MKAPTLTNKDHDAMDRFFAALLDDYRDGVIDKFNAVGTLGHVVAAIYIDNYSEARNWFKDGHKLIRENN